MIEPSVKEKLYNDVTLRSSSEQSILTDAVGVCAVVDGIGINEISKIVTRIFAFITINSHTIILTFPLIIHKGDRCICGRLQRYPLCRIGLQGGPLCLVTFQLISQKGSLMSPSSVKSSSLMRYVVSSVSKRLMLPTVR